MGDLSVEEDEVVVEDQNEKLRVKRKSKVW